MVKISFIAILVCCCFSATSQQFEVELIETSLKGNVYSPSFYKDGLVVCGDRKNSLLFTYVDVKGSNPVDLYYINKHKPSEYKEFDENFKSNLHDGPICFADFSEFAAVSKNALSNLPLKQLQQKTNQLGIFFSFKNGAGWSKLEPFPFNDSSYTCTHPALTADGKTLYFASNMPSGFGGYDIWKSEKTDEKWSKPENLGNEINTDNDELFPTVINNQIYFSSKRGDIGGLDIYHIRQGIPKLLDSPLNSESDDFGLISSDKGKTGYFTSGRNGKDELFKFKSLHPVFDNCSEVVEVEFCYTIEDEYADQLDSDGVIYEWDINGIKLRGRVVEYCFPGIGDYDIILNAIDTVINETYYELSYFFISLTNEIQPYISVPSKIVPEQEFLMSAERSNLPGKEVEDYYWKTSDDSRYTGLTANHKFSKEGDFEIQLGVVFKDGSEPQCVTKQIKSTFEEASFVPKKLEDRQNQKNYPFAADPNYVYSIEAVNSDSIINDESFRLALEKYGNVRIKYIKEDKAYMYLVGEFKSIEEAHPVWQELKKNGYENATVKPFTKDEFDDFQIDKVFILENLVFDEDSWKIKAEFQKDLDLIAIILSENAGLRIRIDAHTDATGSPEYNLNLSMNRAKSVKKYLIETGIDSNRIDEQGLGESKPLGDNATEEGKKRNRRVEFTLLK